MGPDGHALSAYALPRLPPLPALALPRAGDAERAPRLPDRPGARGGHREPAPKAPRRGNSCPHDAQAQSIAGAPRTRASAASLTCASVTRCMTRDPSQEPPISRSPLNVKWSTSSGPRPLFLGPRNFLSMKGSSNPARWATPPGPNPGGGDEGSGVVRGAVVSGAGGGGRAGGWGGWCWGSRVVCGEVDLTG